MRRRPGLDATLIAAAFLAAALQTALALTNVFVLDRRFPSLDVSSDRNLFGWATVVLTWGGAAALASTLEHRRGRSAVRAGVLVLLLVFLGADDLLGLHERLSGLHPSPAVALAVAAFAAAVCTAFVLLWREAAAHPRSPAVRAGLAVLGLAVAARGLAVVIVLSSTSTDDALRAVATAGVQGLDLAGWILVGGGLLLARRPALRRVDRQLAAYPALGEQHSADAT